MVLDQTEGVYAPAEPSGAEYFPGLRGFLEERMGKGNVEIRQICPLSIKSITLSGGELSSVYSIVDKRANRRIGTVEVDECLDDSLETLSWGIKARVKLPDENGRISRLQRAATLELVVDYNSNLEPTRRDNHPEIPLV